MSPTNVAVVIPVYREELTELEKISLAQCRKVLGRYPTVFVAPEGKNFSYFAAGDMVANFPARYFQNTETYTQLMLSQKFYEAFLSFDYMLVYQLDAFVFYDALENFCRLGYDYIGAPWAFMHKWRIDGALIHGGNGGFSLRRVKACHAVLSEHFDWITRVRVVPEDVFLAYCGSRDDIDFNIAPVGVANKFSAEFNIERTIRKNGGEIPFGCHYWPHVHKNFYVELFARFGWDLRPVEHLMSDSDYGLTQWLLQSAMKRLLRRLERGRSLSRYLPTKKFSAVRVVRSPEAMKILARLLTEENSLTDKIFFCDATERASLFRDATREDLPQLIVADNDAPLIAAAERQGLRYGEDFFSFQREYLSRCEKMFHGLGK